MWEGEVNICLRATTPWKHLLSSPFGKGWGSSLVVIIILFYFGGEFLQFVKKKLEKESPKFIYFLKSPKIATMLSIV
jgi:hypothetical protein